MNRIAAFISPTVSSLAIHAITALRALQLRCPGVGIELFTTVTKHLNSAAPFYGLPFNGRDCYNTPPVSSGVYHGTTNVVSPGFSTRTGY